MDADAMVLPFRLNRCKVVPAAAPPEEYSNRSQNNWDILSIRRLPAFISGSIARLRFWNMRFCSIPPSNGCTTNDVAAGNDGQAAWRVIWNSW